MRGKKPIPKAKSVMTQDKAPEEPKEEGESFLTRTLRNIKESYSGDSEKNKERDAKAAEWQREDDERRSRSVVEEKPKPESKSISSKWVPKLQDSPYVLEDTGPMYVPWHTSDKEIKKLEDRLKELGRPREVKRGKDPMEGIVDRLKKIESKSSRKNEKRRDWMDEYDPSNGGRWN